jgi:NAD+ diphosphatase
MLILNDNDVLLGRQSVWPPGLYSLLAGFMEPGETIEDAVRRETKEESGIEVSSVAYIGCQPWPFPSSLMLGCVGRAISKEITIDPEELESALWVSRDEMRLILDGKHSRIVSPRKYAIARALLTDWVNDDFHIPGA